MNRTEKLSAGWLIAGLAVGAHYLPWPLGVCATGLVAFTSAVVWTCFVCIMPQKAFTIMRNALRDANRVYIPAATPRVEVVMPATLAGATTGDGQQVTASPPTNGEAAVAEVALCDYCDARPAIAQVMLPEDAGGPEILNVCATCKEQAGFEEVQPEEAAV